MRCSWGPLDLTIVNVALPAVQQDFGASTGELSLVATAYLTSLAVVTPASGWVAQRLGAPLTFLAAVATFTAASALGALAWDLPALVTARAVQGIGGGLLVPVAMTLLFRAFPEDERATASALFAVPGAVAPALGPFLGGALVDAASWRWVFIINVPVGTVAFLLGLLWLRNESPDPDQPLDVAGFGLTSAGVVGLVLALTWLADGSSVRVVVAAGVAAVALTVLVRTGSRRPSSFVDLGLFRRRSFAVGQITMLVSSAGFGGLLFALPLVLQGAEGLSARETGLVMAVHAVGILLVTPLGPRLVRRFGDRTVLAVGIAGSAVTTAGFAALTQGSSPLGYAALLLPAGMLFGLMIVPQQTMPFADLTDAQLSQGTSLLSTVRQLGVALGTSLVALPIAWMAGSPGASWAFALAGLVTLVGVPAALAGTGRARESRTRDRHEDRDLTLEGQS